MNTSGRMRRILDLNIDPITHYESKWCYEIPISDYSSSSAANEEDLPPPLLDFPMIIKTEGESGAGGSATDAGNSPERVLPMTRSSTRKRNSPVSYFDPIKIKKEKMEKMKKIQESESEDEHLSDNDTPTRRSSKSVGVFGKIPGIAIGTCWERRVDCAKDGIHRPWVAGIHGTEREGCYSIALSGGYDDDVDCGKVFTYTGSGGRDLRGTVDNPKNLRTAGQSKDQELTKGNKALQVSFETQKPIRVIRGFKLKSRFAPETGYRYDGLYVVEKYWQAKGVEGFMVWRFQLKYCDDQVAPWEVAQELNPRKYPELKTYGTSVNPPKSKKRKSKKKIEDESDDESDE